MVGEWEGTAAQLARASAAGAATSGKGAKCGWQGRRFLGRGAWNMWPLPGRQQNLHVLQSQRHSGPDRRTWRSYHFAWVRDELLRGWKTSAGSGLVSCSHPEEMSRVTRVLDDDFEPASPRGVMTNGLRREDFLSTEKSSGMCIAVPGHRVDCWPHRS